MKGIAKILKWLGYIVLALLIIGNLAIIFTGRYYIYKGIASTYLRGYVRPNIYDQDVFTNRVVPAGTAQPWVESSFSTKINLTQKERKRIEDLKPASFLVSWGDTIIFEEYWDEHDRNRTSNSFSMAKSIISLLIGVAIDEGKINSIDDPVADYVEEFADEKKNITIRHLLTMSTGLSWSESYSHPFCDVAELYYDTDDRDLSTNRRVVEEEPGVTWRYKSGDTQVLVYVLQEATGQNVSDYASEKLWKPMGAESDALWSLAGDENSTEKAFCCFYSTSRDFLRLGKLVNQNGNWNGKQLVNADYMKEFKTLAPLKKDNGKPNNAYGLQYWIYKGLPYEVTYFRGMSGQYIISIPSKELVIVRTGNGTEGGVVESKNEGNIGHYAEFPFYIETANRILMEHQSL
jgi:CubicO group peptidase (beta-lactamase class C family)